MNKLEKEAREAGEAFYEARRKLNDAFYLGEPFHKFLKAEKECDEAERRFEAAKKRLPMRKAPEA